MNKLAELAGYFAAHAIWCVSDGGPLTPIYAYELADGQRGINRLVVDNSTEAQRIGRQYFRDNVQGAELAVLLYDEYVNIAGIRRDAIVAVAEDFGLGIAFTIVVPYRTADSPEGFGVFPVHLLNKRD